MSDWPEGKAIRRLAVLRNDIHGQHKFDGPKMLALFRLLDRAQHRGRIIVAVLPVSQTYIREFLTPDVNQAYERALSNVRQSFPSAHFVRLDKLAPVQSDEYFSDHVHLNAAGRRIVTRVFLEQIAQDGTHP
jgi:lysophospholipase L1-like esterase